MAKLIDDCFVSDKPRLRHAEALAILKGRVGPTADVETIALAAAAGRVLALPATAKRPVPAYANAAVDGYSFAAAHYDREHGAELSVEGRATAGHPLEFAPRDRVAVRIFTGAALPKGHDTVAMQEDVVARADDDQSRVVVPPGLKAGANVREAGEDMAAGQVVLETGTALRPQELAALASLGAAEVTCFKRLRVGVISSGDEVVRVGAMLGEAQVYDANAPMLSALIENAGALATDLGVLPDNVAQVKARLADAAEQFDVIITTGGASRGEEDHVAAAVEALGKRHLWQLAIKPGRPMLFGQIRDCAVLGMPGNPVAVLVCFLLYAWPLLRRMGGAAWSEPRRLMLPALFAFPARKTGRREFWRGMLKHTPRGLAVDKFTRDGSGLISGLTAADGLIEIPEETGDVMSGDPVAFISFTEFGILPR